MTREEKLREYLKRVTADLALARRQLADVEAGRHEPIAIVGMSCRFPGAEDVDAYWELVRDGRSAVVDDASLGRFELDRSVDEYGVYTRRAAVLPDIAGWDNEFFGSPPREALRMDPQQRLLMELAWEAMEDSGQPPPSLAGSRTAVMVGFSDLLQYGRLQESVEAGHSACDPFAGQGSSASVVAGRLAYHFDLRGPTLTLDTACSSSLVAVHLAAESLRRGESELALAGGAFLLMHPDVFVVGCATSQLSRDGLCKTFDARADGYVLGEGGGVVVLERLRDAVRNGRRIHAVIRGSALNQDGRSNGLTAPNRTAQVEVIRAALAAAGTSAEDVAYVEAHGSGTALGDAIELGALNDVFGSRPADRPLRVGAVKTNIGHTQAAAGMAGLIKTVLVLQQGVVPPNLNMSEPAEAVLASRTVRPATTSMALADGDAPSLAGVSSFGWTGTNAHVVLAGAPATEPRADERAGAHLLPVSATTQAGLREQLGRLAAGVGDARPGDVAYTLQSARAEHPYRRAVLVTDGELDRVGARLDAAAAAAGPDRLTGAARVAFLFGDAGATYPGLGAQLYHSEPVYAAAIERCIESCSARCGVELRAALTDENIDSIGCAATQDAAQFSVQFALAQLLTHRGVGADVLVGRGLGEYAAACLAGVYTLSDALWVVTERARLLGSADATAESVRAALSAIISSLPRQEPRTPMIADSTQACAAYCAERGVTAWVELGAGPDLTRVMGRADATNPAPAVSGTLPARDVDRLPGAEAAGVLRTCGALWELGVALDWSALRSAPGRLVTLPGYPFQRQRFWVDALAPGAPGIPATDAEAPAPLASVQLMAQHWSACADVAASPLSGRYVLIGDRGGVAEQLAHRIGELGAGVTMLSTEAELGRPGALDGDEPLTVVHLCSLDRGEDDAVRAVLSVARTLATCGARAGRCRVLVVTRGGQAVAEESVAPVQAALAVLPVVGNQEYLNLDCRGLDLDPAYPVSGAVAAIEGELGRPSDGPLVAHRAGARQAPGYGPLAAERPAHPVRSGGAYLITGGLGDIGLSVAEHLVRAGAGRVVLTSRSGLSADAEHPRNLAVRRLRELGARVDTPRVDGTDPAAVRAVFAGGRIDGVVHAAAEAGPETFRALRDLAEADVARHFGAKVGGARVLADVLGELAPENAPEWCLLFSSTSALLGGVTFASYGAANAALSALARAAAGTRTRWIAAEWDTWASTLGKLEGGIGASMRKHAMTDAQAFAAFDGLVGQRGVAVVAAGGLTPRLPGPPGPGADPTALAPLVPRVRYPRPDLPQPYAAPLNDLERDLAQMWGELLGIDGVGTRDNFFDLGGNSLLVPHLIALLQDRLGVMVPTVTLFEAPTIRALATALTASPGAAAEAGAVAPTPAVAPAPLVAGRTPAPEAPALEVVAVEAPAGRLDRRIAIVGMSGRFPGARDVASFWRNVCGGVDSISFFSPDELIAAGVAPELVDDPSYVPARPVLEDISGFDAAFFGISPRMAAISDPQQRLFLEVCWEALEQSGYCRPEHRGRVGVFGGANISTYLLGIADQLTRTGDVSDYELIMGNDKDALTTTVSYLFDLYGPSVAVQTFCSTSLVAVHLAVQSLRSGDCEMALAGGVSIRVPDKLGHLYTPGGMESHDGHVHTFDADASGTMFGDGATVVVLKRLADAVRDGDHVYGVIRGSAMNNDGALKVGYTAPSVAGQARVVVDAMADAGVVAEDISYVEAHGTATELGDPIEVAALTRAFGPTSRRQYCPIGAVKTNVGHLNHAAGTAGLIKTALALEAGVIPPTLHYTSPNPKIDFEHSPFFVNTDLAPWTAPEGRPRIAGLNSLGMGGTNVHVVLEQPPVRPAVQEHGDPATNRRYHVLPVSARTETAAQQSCHRLAEHLAGHPDTNLADVAYSLQVGRKTFEHRRTTVVTSVARAVATLGEADSDSAPLARLETAEGRPVAFLFDGVGEQYPGLAGELYRREPVFRAVLADCLARLGPSLPDVDLADLLLGGRGGAPDLAALLGRGSGVTDERVAALKRTEVVQPLLFALDYALARTLMAWGVRPSVMLGYSLGEYVAACISGVLSLDDALALVVHRATLIATVETGEMAAVPMAADELRRRFGLEQRALDIAAINGPDTVVVAGPHAAMQQLGADLQRAAVAFRPLETTHAFHSRMLAPLAAQLAEWITANVTLNPPELPYLSNVTGARADAALVCDPAYWARHMCQTVQFAAGAEQLLADAELAVIEIGPGQSLGALTRGAGCPPQRWPLITATLPAAGDPRPADAVLTDCLARLWLVGVEVDWVAYHGRGEGCLDVYPSRAPGRIPLPTYPFQRQQYWIEAAPRAGGDGLPAEPRSLADVAAMPRLAEDHWLSLPVWRQAVTPAAAEQPPASWLVYAQGEVSECVLAQLRAAAPDAGAVTVVRVGQRFARSADGYTVRPGSAEDALAVLHALREKGMTLERVVHLWSLDVAGADDTASVSLGLHTLVALARAAGEFGAPAWDLDIVTSTSQDVLGGEARPETSTLTGPLLVIPLEYPAVTTRLIDIEPGTAPADVLAELLSPRTEQTVAIRGRRRWIPGYGTVAPAPLDRAGTVLREGGVYLITGGLGGIALGMAEQLAIACRAKLVLLARQGLPPRALWDDILSGAKSSDDSTRSRVARVRSLIELGAQVEIVVGDVTEAQDVARAIERAQERFGGLHGVLHVAGVPGTGLMQFKEPSDSDVVLAAKVAGTRAIAEALRLEQPDEVLLDFLVLFSSITSATGGGPGQVDYCAANAFLDGFAAQLAATGRRVLALDWGEWAWNAWDSEMGGFGDELQTFFRTQREKYGITFEEGWRTLLRGLASGEPRLVVSTQDLATMVRFSRHFTVDAVSAPLDAAASGPRHPRPELVTPYQAPSGPVEEQIAEVWCETLRLERVGAWDNFFELGGSSLLGIGLLAALRRCFPDAQLPPHILYEAPTVLALAGTLEHAPADAEAAEGEREDDRMQGQQRRSGLKAAAARRRRT